MPFEKVRGLFAGLVTTPAGYLLVAGADPDMVPTGERASLQQLPASAGEEPAGALHPADLLPGVVFALHERNRPRRVAR